jgi:lysophospholipase L1-like esterase
MLNPVDGSKGLIAASAPQQVPVLRPVVSGDFDAQLYRDGFHLNDEGAALFTERLIPVLRQELDTSALVRQSN